MLERELTMIGEEKWQQADDRILLKVDRPLLSGIGLDESKCLGGFAAGKTVLEIGTLEGASALSFVLGGAKQVVTVDTFSPEVMTNSGDRENYSRPYGLNGVTIQQTFNILHIHPVVMIVGRSCDCIPLLRDKFFDVIFIDGGHMYETVKSDWRLCLPKLKDGGVMLLHDYGDTYDDHIQVKEFVDNELGEYRKEVLVGSILRVYV